ncbi:HEL012Wp [Eremothecium sinecaudum]|uniref:HEL012Wp n=1 Tax=Eremothecium sinecaudum TaxID=45286 RepID=A0A109UZF1_9SACH|nr:HEL012Wp [Eremothecium sinecaudum]AMD21268.1 HEL012Wp [Eremothecium sinecaudum]
MASDQFVNLGRALSTTASVVLGSQSVEDTILSYSSPYKKMLHDSITNSGGKTSLMKASNWRNRFSLFSSKNGAFQDLFHATSGKSYFKNGFGNSRTSFQVLSYLSDELLADVPNSHSSSTGQYKALTENGERPKKKKHSKTQKNDVSLFQGFEASLPVIDQTISSHQKRIGNKDIKSIREAGTENMPDALEEEEDQLEFRLPEGVSLDTINNTYSIKALSNSIKLITDNLDLLEIQKNLAASEIKELDMKMEKIKAIRDLVFKRIATVEQNELFLEKHLLTIKDRIDMIEDYDLDNDDGNDHVVTSPNGPNSPSKKNQIDGASPIDSNSQEEPRSPSTKSTMNQSQLKYMHINHEKKMKQHELSRSRKTHPTLQQYYEPGANITSFSSAHDDKVTCLDFNMPFGTLCSAGKMDPTIKVWDLSKNSRIASISGHLATISCMQMDEYNTLITGGRDALLKMWDIQKAVEGNISPENDVCIHTFDSHIDEITALSFDGSTLVSGSQDRTIRQWDLKNGKCVQTIDISFATGGGMSRSMMASSVLDANEAPIIGALQCYDAALATGTKDGIVRLWDLRTGRVVRTLDGHTDAVTSLQFDSMNLITGSLDNSIRIWDLRTGTLADAFAYEHPVTCLQFDLQKIVAANQEGTVKVYDRQHKKHWFCGGDEKTENVVEFVRYKDGYLVEGRGNGDINAWAI